jgi:hypothetical protein
MTNRVIIIKKPHTRKHLIMQTNLTRTILILVAVIFGYTSCKKAATTPTASTTAIDYKVLSGQIAATLYQSITGQHGGTDVSKGITAPSNIAVSGYKTLAVNSFNPLCGFTIDSTYNYTNGKIPVNDTLKSFFGNFHFVYLCDANQVDGYNVHDSLRTALQYRLFNFDTIKVAQNYYVKALDQTYKLVSMDGSISTLAKQRNIEALILRSVSSIYYLSGLRVDFASGTADIIAGIATFHTQTIHSEIFSYINEVVDYYGTIEYLGNHMAKLTINPGHVYMVNLTTGAVTAV